MNVQRTCQDVLKLAGTLLVGLIVLVTVDISWGKTCYLALVSLQNDNNAIAGIGKASQL